MARNISEIKSEMAQEFMRNESAAELYGFEPGAAFGDVFGAASVENILLYVWAVCAWTVEQLVARHKREMTAELEELIAHRPKWYRDKVLQFMAGKELEADSDTYDTEGMSESEVSAARVCLGVFRVVRAYGHGLLPDVHAARGRASLPRQNLPLGAGPRPHEHVAGIAPGLLRVCLAAEEHHTVAANVGRQRGQCRKILHVVQRLAVKREVPVCLRQKIA